MLTLTGGLHRSCDPLHRSHDLLLNDEEKYLITGPRMCIYTNAVITVTLKYCACAHVHTSAESHNSFQTRDTIFEMMKTTISGNCLASQEGW